MESLPSVSPSIVISRNHVKNIIIHHQPTRRVVAATTTTTTTSHRITFTTTTTSLSSNFLLPEDYYYYCRGSGRGRGRRRCRETRCGGGVSGRGGGDEDDGRHEDLERALRLDSSIPGNCDEFVKRVSSRAYDMRRHLHQTFDSSSYDVLEANPWREGSKPVYVLTHGENQLCTMKTRRNRSEVERELGLLFSKGGNWRSEFGNKKKQSRSGTKFRMLVEDVREGVLVFEDENDAARYCDLLQGGGQGCEGVAEIEASSVFDICRMMRALAVLFRRGMTPPLPESLELNLKARKRSLEDQEDLI